MTIKISNSLSGNAFTDPTKGTTQERISDLCKGVDSQGIIMPIFQRDLAWIDSKKVDLFNFQLNGFSPVSPISMNETGKKSSDITHVTLIDRLEIENLEKGKLSVIDGQQRISTNYQAYINDESIKDIVLDISRGVFIDLNGKKIKKNQIPVGILYNKDHLVYLKYIEEHRHLTEYNVSSLLGQIRTKFLNYTYTVNYAKDLSGEQQIKWFDVLNLAGSRVPEVQMKLTLLQVKGLDFYKEYADIFREKIELKGLSHLFIQKNTEISIPLATLNPAIEIITNKKHTSNYSPIPSDAKKSAISDMEVNDLRDCFNMTIEGLDTALEFINENTLQNPSRIDKITYLTGYFVYNKGEFISGIRRNNLINWYKEIIFINKTNSERRQIFDLMLNI